MNISTIHGVVIFFVLLSALGIFSTPLLSQTI